MAEMWQETPRLVAVQWKERLHWEDVNGRVHAEDPEPVYLVPGLLPETDAGRRAVVARLQNGVLKIYRSIEGIQRTWWQ